MPQKSELQELIDTPNETLNAEYKGWLDLVDDQEARASLARHIAALANHGGGIIVFGFTDELKEAGTNPFAKVKYDRDLVAAIVKKYLEPTFQCDVFVLQSTSGLDHPVIAVPAHGAVPICAKASGPTVNGKTKGITAATYYIRKAGPESAPIQLPAEWTPLIRRCALHERSAILSIIDASLRGALEPISVDELKIWHEAAHAAFLSDISSLKGPSWLAKSHCQLSYSIERSDGQELPLDQLKEMLRQVNGEVRDLVRTGWSMFHPFTRPEIEPYFNAAPESGLGDKDFLECALLRDTKPVLENAFDMWRVAANGKATIIRPYWEDDADWARRNLAPGTWLSPNMLVRALAELVRHARGISERFDSAITASFRCEWWGLSDRTLADPNAHWSAGRIARTDHRISTGTWPVPTLTNGWNDIVASLAAPVVRAFTSDFVISREWVTAQSPTWLR